MTVEATDRIAELERKIDVMAAQMEVVAAEAREQRLRRQQWQELVSDLAPISGEAMTLASRELEAVQDFVEPSDMLRLLRRILRNTNNIEEGLAKYESAMELLSDAGPLASQAVANLIEVMDEYDRRGYFEFAGAGLGVVDRIVTNYSKEDVEALGDNVVHMLDIVKNLTQPEMLAVAERLLEVVQRQQRAAVLEPEEPPSLFALAGKMRDPEIRRGMGRALNTFKAVSAVETESATAIIDANQTNNSPEGGA
jgi:uncharacterized protein YjgD (DUF1641 family)